MLCSVLLNSPTFSAILLGKKWESCSVDGVSQGRSKLRHRDRDRQASSAPEGRGNACWGDDPTLE